MGSGGEVVAYRIYLAGGHSNWQFGIPSLATYVRKEVVSMILDRIKEENALLSFRRVHSYFKLASKLPISYLEENLNKFLNKTSQKNQADDHLAFFSELGILCPAVSQIIVFLRHHC